LLDKPIFQDLPNTFRNLPFLPNTFQRSRTQPYRFRPTEFTRVFVKNPIINEFNNDKLSHTKSVAGLWGTILSVFSIYEYALELLYKNFIKGVNDGFNKINNIPLLIHALGLYFSFIEENYESKESSTWSLVQKKRSLQLFLYDSTWFFPNYISKILILLFDIFTFHSIYLITLIAIALLSLMIPALQVYPSAFVISRYKVRQWLTFGENEFRFKKKLPYIPFEKIS
jgi:hypothetical protein